MQRQEQHWLLNDQDARAYGQALQNAIRHLPVSRAQKAVDFTMFFIAAFNFETPRIYLSTQLARARRAQGNQPRRGPAQVFQFHPPAPAGPSSPVKTSPSGSPAGETPAASASPQPSPAASPLDHAPLPIELDGFPPVGPDAA